MNTMKSLFLQTQSATRFGVKHNMMDSRVTWV